MVEATLDARLIAVDLRTGEPCKAFGQNGAVDHEYDRTPIAVKNRFQGGDQPITTLGAAHNPKSPANKASRRLDAPCCSRTILRSRYSLRYERRRERSSTHECDCPKLFLGQRRLSSRFNASSAPLCLKTQVSPSKFWRPCSRFEAKAKAAA
ncbi:hypothetical protein [Pseudomonas hunanensis]|uniref:hypothetical protein n=1 Tax=Pseudomonas hunanensis TaxID=1247546 RepID=UPI0040426ACC